MKRPPPWLFVLTGMPYGVVGQFSAVVMPHMAEKAGADIGEIGWYSTLLYVPAILLFLYAPIVDLGPRRKHWLAIVSLLGAACLAAACMMPLPQHTTAFLGLVLAAQTISGLVGSCNGALMAMAVPDELRGKAGAAFNIGNLSGGGLSSTAAIWMVGHGVAPWIIGAVLAALMVLPSLAVLGIDEPRQPPRAAREVFRPMLRDVGRVMASRAGLTGLLLCMSPVGTAALSNYFSGMSKPYGASTETVALVTGIGSTILTAAGAFLGGVLCDRFNRRAMYLTAGSLTALCGIAMAASPRTELTFALGATIYALITGFCYSAFTATVLETIGTGGRTAATQYSLFVAAGNLAITYVGLIDTRFDERYGVEGVIASDATLNLAGVALLALAFWRLGMFGRRRAPTTVAP